MTYLFYLKKNKKIFSKQLYNYISNDIIMLIKDKKRGVEVR